MMLTHSDFQKLRNTVERKFKLLKKDSYCVSLKYFPNDMVSRAIINQILDSYRDITQPLLLISQIQRSGGSLMAQLFDGHPELYAHPHELKIGYPSKKDWPPLESTNNKERWFSLLFEHTHWEFLQYGYSKSFHLKDKYKFYFLPNLQRAVFLNVIKRQEFQKITQRDIFNAFMTAYFSAWINYHGHYQTKSTLKAYVTGFAPRLTDSINNVEKYFSVYPDGKIISIVRDPKNWYPSIKKMGKFESIDLSVERYKESSLALLRNKKLYPDCVYVIPFEALVNKREKVMRSVAAFMGITYDDVLLKPTFNSQPVHANSSFKEGMGKVTDRHNLLTTEEKYLLKQKLEGLYKSVMSVTDVR